MDRIVYPVWYVETTVTWAGSFFLIGRWNGSLRDLLSTTWSCKKVPGRYIGHYVGIDRYEVSCRQRGLVTGSGTLHWMLRWDRSLRGFLSTPWPCKDVALDVTWESIVTRSPVDDVALSFWTRIVLLIDPLRYSWSLLGSGTRIVLGQDL